MPRKVAKGATEKPTVQVAKPSKDRLVEWLMANERPEQGLILGKLIDWFVEQPPEIQQMVLRRVPSRVADAYADALEVWAAELRSKSAEYNGNTEGPPTPLRGGVATPLRRER